jgi:hypothetical protein
LSIKTQFTQLYFLDPDGNVPTEVDCVTSLTGLSASRDQIETTCLNSPGRTYEAGMPTPGTANFTINFDGSQPSHVRLHELYVSGETLDWAIGLSDGTAPPTADESAGFTYPGTRSWLAFEGFINDFPFDFALNSVITSNLGIQVSGLPVFIAKT